jgi:hypothetical protein
VRVKSIFICGFLLISSLAFASELKEVIKKEFPLSSGGVFVLTNRNGDIVITPWEEDKVAITARKQVKAGNSLVAKRVFKEVKVVAEKRGDKVVVTTEYPERKGFLSFLPGRDWEFKVDYEVYVPRKVFLEIESRNGDIEVGKTVGGAELVTRNGYINAEGLTGEIKASSRNGDIKLSFLAGGASASTRNGHIKVGFVELSSERKLRFSSRNGDIELLFPPDIKADIYLSSEYGSIYTDFPLTVERVRKKVLRGKINKGGVSVEVETRNGTIRIKKSKTG